MHQKHLIRETQINRHHEERIEFELERKEVDSEGKKKGLMYEIRYKRSVE